MTNQKKQMKQWKAAVLRRLLVPILIIAAALLYEPAKKWLDTGSGTVPVTDGSKLQVAYIDVGQGDATLISKGDFHLLIDAGNNQHGETVVEYLKSQKIEHLDIVVGTHSDSDHIGGLDTVVEQVAADTVYMALEDKDTKTYKDVLAALKKKGLSAEMPEIGKEYRYEDNVVLRFLSPGKKYSDSNDSSLVLQLAFGENRFLFMGDAEEKAEKDILARGYDLECDVLKLGHHGSYTATGKEFLKEANPTYGIISCGESNSYGHPHAETLAKLEDEDVQVYRTDTMGTIVAVSDGRDVTLSTSGN